MYAGLAVLAGYILQEAIENTDSADPAQWKLALPLVQFNSFFGGVQFNKYHQNIAASYITLQNINGTIEYSCLLSDRIMPDITERDLSPQDYRSIELGDSVLCLPHAQLERASLLPAVSL